MKFLLCVPVFLATIVLHGKAPELPRAYVSVQSGLSVENSFKDEDVTISSQLGSAHSITGGIRIYKGLTAEGEVGYVHNKFEECSVLGYGFGIDGHIHKTKLASNLLYEYAFENGTSVYAGLGGAQMWESRSLRFLPVCMNGYNINLGSYTGKNNQWCPQVIGGWNFSNSENYQLGMRVTHMRCQNNMDNSSISFSLKRKIGS